jgi:hypothetical protein
LRTIAHKARSNTLNEIENMEDRPAEGNGNRKQSEIVDIATMLRTVS